mgnify:CR=1 FL=1
MFYLPRPQSAALNQMNRKCPMLYQIPEDHSDHEFPKGNRQTTSQVRLLEKLPHRIWQQLRPYSPNQEAHAQQVAHISLLYSEKTSLRTAKLPASSLSIRETNTYSKG